MESVTAVGWKLYEWKTEHQFLGRYSVDKLQHFGRYDESSSLAKCLGVICVLALVPTFVLVMALDVVPLKSPELGLGANSSAIVRSVVGHGLTGIALGLCMKQALVGATSSEGCSLAFFLSTGLVITLAGEAVLVILTLLWRFPIPARELLSLLLSIAVAAFYSRVILRQRLGTLSYRRVCSFLRVAMTHWTHLWLFLAFALGFARAPAGVQVVLIVVQPVLKALLKRQVWVLARKLGDLSTDVTLSLVEISAALCQALCVQHARHAVIAALLVLWELVLGLFEVRMYAMHDFVVDHQRTLQTACKIVEGSLPLPQVAEAPETARVAPELPVMTREAAPPVSTARSVSTALSIADSLTPSSPRSVPAACPAAPSLSSLLAAGPAWRRDNDVLQMSAQRIQQLRRTASDTIHDHSKLQSESLDGQTAASASREPSAPSSSSNRPERPARRYSYSWTRDPAKIYCYTEPRSVREPSSSITVQREKKRPDSGSQPPQGSPDRPPLAHLQPLVGLEDSLSCRPSRRSSSVFLTPRTLLKSGSKRLMDLQRSGGRSSRRGSGKGAAMLGLSHQDSIRRPSQVNIDGMLVTRKDQARILEQTLQLLFSCEVLVVAEFVKVLVPVLHGLLLVTLWHLPNAEYSVLLRDVTHERMLSRALWCLGYAVAELPSLAYLCVTVLGKYGVSPLRLLTFVLEQYWMTFHGKLIGCFVTLLFCVSVHQGMDFKVTP